jgi:lipid-A-disaccharide synthase
MKYYLIAGEASGDMHASELMSELKKIDTKADFRFFGGNLMKRQGGQLVKHYKDMAFMGLWEVIRNIGKIKYNLNLCKNDILGYNPDVLILVDYPGFNLKIAEFSHKKKIKTIYYISPKIWAWKKKRVKKIKEYIDKMFVIFPFEVNFYKKYNYKVEYPGNPSLHIVKRELSKHFDKEKFLKENNLDDRPIIALLPGSRKQEIEQILPDMLKIIKHFADFQFIIAGISSLPGDLYNNFIKNYDIKIIFDQTYNLLKISRAAVVTSGTATLETALFKVPQVVCYKTSKLTYSIGKIFVHIKYFSLVNILMQKEVVKELLQNKLAESIAEELKNILHNKDYRKKMLEEYDALEKLLGQEGAPQKAAISIYDFLTHSSLQSLNT